MQKSAANLEKQKKVFDFFLFFVIIILGVINNGEIIEQYPDDYPFPSCLILVITINDEYVHVVVSMDDGKIYLITAYKPSLDKWESDLKTRKRVSQ